MDAKDREELIAHLKRYRFTLMMWFDSPEAEEFDDDHPMYKNMKNEIMDNERFIELLEQAYRP